MKRDSSTIASGATLDFDVCVVGAGPAGIVLAESLSRSGLRIGVLESGGERPAPKTQEFAAGESSGIPYYRLERARTRAFGGSSWQWSDGGSNWPHAGGMRARALESLDIEARPEVPFSGWPFGIEELAPWYTAAEERCRLPAVPGIEALRDAGEPLLDLGPTLAPVVSTFALPDLFTSLRDLEVTSNVSLILRATVLEMLLAEDRASVGSLRVAAAGGGWFTVTARQFVLALGGIDNPRLLLASRFGRPGGLANPNGQVGRYFMEHLHVESGVFQPAPGAEAAFAFYRRHLFAGLPLGAALQVSAETRRSLGLLNAVVEFRARSPLFLSPGVRSLAELAWVAGEHHWPPALGRHLANVAAHPRAVANGVFDRLAQRGRLGGTATTLIVTAEQSPNPRSRVTLSKKRDQFGVPLPHLDWQLTELDTHSIRATQDVIDAAIQIAGLGRLEQKWGETSPTPYLHSCHHHMGTTRISPDATTGVVDANCRVHGLTNLSMAGSSVMPTGGGVTVTFTAIALAYRLAAHLQKVISAPAR
ncbi:MAG: GMC family oxidoreductase [bacterium]